MPDKGFTASQDGLNMPFSIEAEQAVLGSVLIDPEVLSTVLTLVRSEYFYLPQHRAIFDVLVSLDTLGSKIDALIVLERLKENGSFDDAAGKNYLVQLAQAVP